ncbi:MAG TPA: hypothetical protein VEX68_19555, partial [Bryobacteraceae bacterium]|nr:hypothetical protein [Bryobacteraceae bacterium]
MGTESFLDSTGLTTAKKPRNKLRTTGVFSDMTFAREEEPSSRRSLRLWPGIVIVGLQWLVRFGLPVVMPDAAPIAVIGGVVGGLGVVLWWVFFSKAAWFERLGAVGLMIAAMFATSRITHESIATG